MKITKYQLAGSKEMGFTVLGYGFKLLGEFKYKSQAEKFIKQLKQTDSTQIKII